ncbi:MAG: hypothetical protein NC213_08990 [Acetobacter sp.]|nr:hypothetical protein [Bacteroides sp.]MCM1341864.1 hypothetical protein [Acetobacter sp.]MCM1433161.1 hypothetical protein [Clostridiales bacterium]
MAYKSKQRNFRKRETKAEYAARKKAEKEAAYETIDDSISEMMQSDESFVNYLNFQSRMESYSVSNAILIMSRCPDATQLKSKSVWKDLDVEVTVGEDESIHILKPSDYIDNEGNQRRSYNVEYVYDISQTNAEPKPPQKIENKPKVLAIALMDSSPVRKVKVENLPVSNSTAFYDHDKNALLIKLNSNSATLFKDVARELALVEIADGCDEYNRQECLPSAVCSSYMLCQKYGIDNSDMNVTNATKEWSGLENKDVRTNLAMANDGLYAVSKNLYVQLQKDKEKANKEPAR